MSAYRQIRADEVSDLLRRLIERVEARGASADLYIVGVMPSSCVGGGTATNPWRRPTP